MARNGVEVQVLSFALRFVVLRDAECARGEFHALALDGEAHEVAPTASAQFPAFGLGGYPGSSGSPRSRSTSFTICTSMRNRVVSSSSYFSRALGQSPAAFATAISPMVPIRGKLGPDGQRDEHLREARAEHVQQADGVKRDERARVGDG